MIFIFKTSIMNELISNKSHSFFLLLLLLPVLVSQTNSGKKMNLNFWQGWTRKEFLFLYFIFSFFLKKKKAGKSVKFHSFSSHSHSPHSHRVSSTFWKASMTNEPRKYQKILRVKISLSFQMNGKEEKNCGKFIS